VRSFENICFLELTFIDDHSSYREIIFIELEINEVRILHHIDLVQCYICKNELIQVFFCSKNFSFIIGIKFFKNPNEDTDEMEVSIQDLTDGHIFFDTNSKFWRNSSRSYVKASNS
jgi:hypothetical protein